MRPKNTYRNSLYHQDLDLRETFPLLLPRFLSKVKFRNYTESFSLESRNMLVM